MSGKNVSSDFDKFAGNTELKKNVATIIRRGEAAHAYIIEGGQGSGKTMFAHLFAAALICEGKGDGALPCGVCTPCRKVERGVHPDVITVDRGDRATLGIDTIREVRADAFILPSESERKIYIIEDAHLMTKDAQNAFLQVLEEPPSYAVFLLTCTEPLRLLPTVRSRAPTLRLRPLTADEIEEFLLLKEGAKARRLRDSDREGWDELIVASGGMPGVALTLLSGGLKERRRERTLAVKLLCGLISGSSEALVSINPGAGNILRREDAKQLVKDMADALRDMLAVKRSKAAPLCFFAKRDTAQKAAMPYTVADIVRAADAIDELYLSLERNAYVTGALAAAGAKMRQGR
ncbi:MAG: hypothetical protein WBI55_00865 [Eubacteriales bacterium]|nr:hypothetical protein [Clostridiales bacterium]